MRWVFAVFSSNPPQKIPEKGHPYRSLPVRTDTCGLDRSTPFVGAGGMRDWPESSPRKAPPRRAREPEGRTLR